MKTTVPQNVNAAEALKKKETTPNLAAPQVANLNLPPPPLAVSQSQNMGPAPNTNLAGQPGIALHQQIYQQMLQQVLTKGVNYFSS